MAERRIIIISNRLPVTVESGEDGSARLRPSSGGLATGLRAAQESRGGTWIGWSGDAGPSSPEVTAALAAQDLAAVPISAEEIESYYRRISNQCLWPLMHSFDERMQYRSADWHHYVAVNQRFADRVLSESAPEDLVFVQDFHLSLVPRMVKEKRPEQRVGFFLHTPFPSAHVFRTFPERRAFLEGLAAADVVGVHTSGYARHLRDCFRERLGAHITGDEAILDGHRCRVVVRPLGVDSGDWESRARSAAVAAEMESLADAFGDRRLLLGVERMDYTKGIPERLRAFDLLLERHPEWNGRVHFLQVAVPSRLGVEDYEELEREVATLAGLINSRHGRIGYQPVHYQFRGVDKDRLVALYRMADVCLVTPLRDGLNLVAKEFIASRVDGRGNLLLSEFAGAAQELRGTPVVNPRDVEDMAEKLHRGLSTSEDEERRTMAHLREVVASNTADTWMETCWMDLVDDEGRGVPAPLDERAAGRVAGEWSTAKRCALVLDFDGTLVELQDDPEAVVPPRSVLDALEALAREDGTHVWIVSGRDSAFLSRTFRSIPVGLVAEHGAVISWPGKAVHRNAEGERELEAWIEAPRDDWYELARERMEAVTRSVAGSFVEQKSTGLCWHHRKAEPEVGLTAARSLHAELSNLLAGRGVRVELGHDVVEARPADVTKGEAVERLRGAGHLDADALIVAGDDTTDESMFEALGERAQTVLVGERVSLARWRVEGPSDVRRLLGVLADLRASGGS